MNSLHPAQATVKTDKVDSVAEREHLLAVLRAASCRSKLITAQIDSVAISLKQRLIDCQGAMELAAAEGLDRYLQIGPKGGAK
jgi:hypothetical protein